MRIALFTDEVEVPDEVGESLIAMREQAVKGDITWDITVRVDLPNNYTYDLRVPVRIRKIEDDTG